MQIRRKVKNTSWSVYIHMKTPKMFKINTKELKKINVKAKHSIQLFESWIVELKTAVQVQLVELSKSSIKLMTKN